MYINSAYTASLQLNKQPTLNTIYLKTRDESKMDPT